MKCAVCNDSGVVNRRLSKDYVDEVPCKACQFRITLRQLEVLNHLNSCGVAGSESDGSILRALAKKGLVIQHFNSAPGYVYYTWTITDEAKRAIFIVS